MSRLQELDVGTDENDHTGDELRDGGLKINEAIRKLNKLAMTETEATIAEALLTIVKEIAFLREFRGPDNSLQGKIPYTPQSRTWLEQTGGFWHASYEVRSTLSQSVDLALTLWKSGGFVIGNELGPHCLIGGERPDGQLTEIWTRLVGGKVGGAAVYTAAGSRADLAVAIVPTGTGALLRIEPDSLSTGGNVRGLYANDLQAGRSNAIRVANGGYSGIYSGFDNYTGFLAFCAAIGGGQFNTLEGISSFCAGGTLGHDYGRHYVGVHGWASFSNGGHAQATAAGLKGLSTTAAPVRLTADNFVASTGNVLNLPNNSFHLVELMLTARQSGGSAGTVGDSAWKKATFGIKRGANAAATSLVGPIKWGDSDADAGAVGWTWSIAADATNGGVDVSFTGQLNKTIQLTGYATITEIDP